MRVLTVNCIDKRELKQQTVIFGYASFQEILQLFDFEILIVSFI